MGDCENVRVRELLPELAAGSLPGEARAEVEMHLESCTECRKEAALVRSARALLRREALAVDVERIAAAVSADGRGRGRGQLVRRTRTFAVAAGVVGLLATGAIALSLALDIRGTGGVEDSVRAEGEAVAAPALAVAVPVGGRLADLDADALRDVLSALDELDNLPETEPISMGLWPAEAEGTS